MDFPWIFVGAPVAFQERLRKDAWLVGVVDPTGALPEDEIFVPGLMKHLEGGRDEPRCFFIQNRECLMFKTDQVWPDYWKRWIHSQWKIIRNMFKVNSIIIRSLTFGGLIHWPNETSALMTFNDQNIFQHTARCGRRWGLGDPLPLCPTLGRQALARLFPETAGDVWDRTMALSVGGSLASPMWKWCENGVHWTFWPFIFLIFFQKILMIYRYTFLILFNSSIFRNEMLSKKVPITTVPSGLAGPQQPWLWRTDLPQVWPESCAWAHCGGGPRWGSLLDQHLGCPVFFGSKASSRKILGWTVCRWMFFFVLAASSAFFGTTWEIQSGQMLAAKSLSKSQLRLGCSSSGFCKWQLWRAKSADCRRRCNTICGWIFLVNFGAKAHVAWRLNLKMFQTFCWVMLGVFLMSTYVVSFFSHKHFGRPKLFQNLRLDPKVLEESHLIGRLYRAAEKRAEKSSQGLQDPDVQALFRAYVQSIDTGKHGKLGLFSLWFFWFSSFGWLLDGCWWFLIFPLG